MGNFLLYTISRFSQSLHNFRMSHSFLFSISKYCNSFDNYHVICFKKRQGIFRKLYSISELFHKESRHWDRFYNFLSFKPPTRYGGCYVSLPTHRSGRRPLSLYFKQNSLPDSPRRNEQRLMPTRELRQLRSPKAC